MWPPGYFRHRFSGRPIPPGRRASGSPPKQAGQAGRRRHRKVSAIPGELGARRAVGRGAVHAWVPWSGARSGDTGVTRPVARAGCGKVPALARSAQRSGTGVRGLPPRRLAHPQTYTPRSPGVGGLRAAPVLPAWAAGAGGTGVLQARLGSVGNGSWILLGVAEQLPEGQDGAPSLLAALNVEEQDQALAALGHALHPIPPRSPHLPPAAPGTGPECNPRDAAASRSFRGGCQPHGTRQDAPVPPAQPCPRGARAWPPALTSRLPLSSQ